MTVLHTRCLVISFLLYSPFYPFDLCVQKVTFLDPYYPNAMQSWQSISDLFFSKVGFGTYLYSTYGNILVDFTFIGLIFTLFLFFFVFQRIYRFKAFSPLLRFSCFLLLLSLYSHQVLLIGPLGLS